MSSDQVPTRLEVMGWNSQQLAGYLRMMNLSGCDKVVLKNSISGSRFVNLTDNDLQKFPKLHVPMITKISREISKKEKKRGWSEIVLPTKHHEPADVGGWGEDEFDDDCDNDYESPCSGDEDGSGGDYESPNDDVDPANDYEPPPSEPPEDLAASLCPPLPIGDGDYIDNRERGLPPAPCPRPSPSTLSHRMPGESASRRDHCGGRAGNFPPGVPPPVIRTDKPSNNKPGNKPVNKPGRDSGSNPSPNRGPHRNTSGTLPDSQSRRTHSDATDAPSWHNSLVPSVKPIGRSGSSARPSPNRFDGRREQTPDEGRKHESLPLRQGPLPSRPEDRRSLPHKLTSGDRPSFRPPPPTAAKDLDPRWYVGKVTRGQAEECLKQVRKDGAYLVRDSTKQQANQPFTLMVFYQDKVYNIQIRQQNQQFQLGTGLKVQESFPSVGGIVNHYSQSPLLLIDAKNRSSGQQNQCQLCDPAGYHMTGQNWS